MKVAPAINAASAAGVDPAALRKVAEEFESLLMSEVMKSMRETVDSPTSSGMGKEIFTGMLDQELSAAMSHNSGLGLAELVATQLSGTLSRQPALSSGMVGRLGTPDPEMAAMLAQGSWVAPLAGARGGISAEQSFGAVRPGDRPRQCGGGHCGVDLGRPEGTPVRAASDGVVSKVGRDPDTTTGLWVEVVHHGGRVATRYLHLSKIADGIEAGAPVAAGAELGEVGATGTTAHGNHLHFELLHRLENGTTRWVDPAPFLVDWSKKPPVSSMESRRAQGLSSQESSTTVDDLSMTARNMSIYPGGTGR